MWSYWVIKRDSGVSMVTWEKNQLLCMGDLWSIFLSGLVSLNIDQGHWLQSLTNTFSSCICGRTRVIPAQVCNKISCLQEVWLGFTMLFIFIFDPLLFDLDIDHGYLSLNLTICATNTVALGNTYQALLNIQEVHQSFVFPCSRVLETRSRSFVINFDWDILGACTHGVNMETLSQFCEELSRAQERHTNTGYFPCPPPSPQAAVGTI